VKRREWLWAAVVEVGSVLDLIDISALCTRKA